MTRKSSLLVQTLTLKDTQIDFLHPIDLNNTFFYRKIMNYLRKAFNLYQLTHRVDASTTDIKELDDGNDDNEGGKNGDSTRSAATKARATDMFTRRVELVFGEFGERFGPLI